MQYFCNIIVIFACLFVNYLYMFFIYTCSFLILLSLLFVKYLKKKILSTEMLYFKSVIACIFFLKGYNKIEIGYWRCRLMSSKYYKYLPWIILGAFCSYQSASRYAQTTFDLFYLTTIFMIVYMSLLYLHEHYLKYKYKDLFIRFMSNPKKDKHP